MKTMIAIPALCMALNAAAGCPVENPREQPVIPDAAVASRQEMHRAELQAEQYMLQGAAYLECSYLNRRQHRQLSGQLEMFSERYNDEMARYRSRSRMIAETGQ